MEEVPEIAGPGMHFRVHYYDNETDRTPCGTALSEDLDTLTDGNSGYLYATPP
jgi:proline racemase